MAAYEGVFNVRHNLAAEKEWDLGDLLLSITNNQEWLQQNYCCQQGGFWNVGLFGETLENIFSIAKLAASGFRGQLWSAAQSSCAQGSFLWLKGYDLI